MNNVFCAGVQATERNTAACFKFPVGEFEVSISCHSSLGYYKGHLTRVDLRIYKGAENVTLRYLETESQGYNPTSDFVATLIQRLLCEV